jgi:hypothetical protein
MVITGTILLGIVWGWLSVRLMRGNRWTAIVRVVLGIAGQALVAAKIVAPLGVLWFAGGVIGGILIGIIWVRSLELRTAHPAGQVTG